MTTLKLKRILADEHADQLAGMYLDDTSYPVALIQDHCDAIDAGTGRMLFRFRRNTLPLDLLKLGYESFKGSIEYTYGRGMAAGGYRKRINNDGRQGNISIADKVRSGVVGFMDGTSMVHYCRNTQFTREYFDKFKQGMPFVKHVSDLYGQLMPRHYARQLAVARGTNRNFIIHDTVFTTVTVNHNFATSVHKDSGDLPQGFGNLCVYQQGHYDGCYFCLPAFGVAIDVRPSDMLFVDVHQWHGNTPFKNCTPDFTRISFVMYYRENMLLCKQPTEELRQIKMEKGGYLTLPN